MSAPAPIFLPGVPEERLRAIYGRAAGNEIASGKFASPQSSAALAAFLTHRREIEDFHAVVAGGRVRFAACSWRGWLATFTGAAADHARAVIRMFAP
ncbi:hypothetical protein [Erythrobacter cryptus]|uniref:hypothetical protein n=1 Tax=Erythrobacter cryptus TaxID=196588 RepID=UPI0003F53B7A|nr:hypothetical protein [Erythrobacter cryptus]